MIEELKTHALLGEYDIDITVEFEYFAGCPGDRDTPPTGGSVDILSIVDEDGQQWVIGELSAKDYSRIEEECIIKFEDQ